LRNDDAFTVSTVLGQSSSTAWTTGDVLVCNFFMSALDGIYENMILDAEVTYVARMQKRKDYLISIPN
jgi:hypothetical protein